MRMQRCVSGIGGGSPVMVGSMSRAAARGKSVVWRASTRPAEGEGGTIAGLGSGEGGLGGSETHGGLGGSLVMEVRWRLFVIGCAWVEAV